MATATKSKAARSVNLAELRAQKAKEKEEVKDKLPAVDDPVPPPPPAPPKAIEPPPAPENQREPENPKPKEVPDDFTGVLSRVTEAKDGKRTKYRAKVFGHPVTGIIRWMWKNNFNFLEIKNCLADLLEVPPQDTTLKLQKTQLKNGTKSSVPELNEEQKKTLEAFRIA